MDLFQTPIIFTAKLDRATPQKTGVITVILLILGPNPGRIGRIQSKYFNIEIILGKEAMPEFKPVFKRLKSNSTWEEVVGYCRAVQAGPFIFVSGTTAIGQDGQTFYPFNAYQQTKKCLGIIIENALQKFGAKKENIVRTRMYVTQMDQWQEVAKRIANFLTPKSQQRPWLK